MTDQPQSIEQIEIISCNGSEIGYISYEECAGLNPLDYWYAHNKAGKLIGGTYDKRRAEEMVLTHFVAKKDDE